VVIAVLSVDLINGDFQLLVESCYSLGEVLQFGLECLELDDVALFWREGGSLVEQGLKVWNNAK
jgi:hypothetical protein